MRNICIKESFYQSSSQINARMSGGGGGGFSEKYRTEMPFWPYLVNFRKKKLQLFSARPLKIIIYIQRREGAEKFPPARFQSLKVPSL